MYNLQQNIKISEAKNDRTTGDIDESTIIVGNLNISLSEWRDSAGRKLVRKWQKSILTSIK